METALAIMDVIIHIGALIVLVGDGYFAIREFRKYRETGEIAHVLEAIYSLVWILIMIIVVK